jgi:hypothetical protein
LSSVPTTSSAYLKSTHLQLRDIKVRIKMYTPIALLAASAGLATAATSYKASFTQYGSTDTWGSGNCNVATTACGFYTSVRLLLLLFLLSPFPISFSMLTYLTARLLSRSIPKRIRRRHRRRRRPSMRNLLEVNRIHRLLWQQLILWCSHRGTSYQPLPCGEQPSMRSERVDWHKPIRR